MADELKHSVHQYFSSHCMSFFKQTFGFRIVPILIVVLLNIGISTESYSDEQRWNSIGIEGVFFTTMTVTDSALYAGSESHGVFKKNLAKDDDWIFLGLPDRVIGSILIHPDNSDTIYVGIGSLSETSLFKSTDGGSNWFSSDDGLQDLSTVHSLSICPDSFSVLYAGTQYGLYKSEDEGIHWDQIELSDFPGPEMVYAIAINQTNSDTVYVGGENLLQEGFIYKTVDEGASWSLLDIILMDGQVRSIAIDPLNTQIVYAADRVQGLFKSTNGGESWIRIYEELSISAPSCIVVDPSNTTTIYLATIDQGVLKTIDGGEHWNELNIGLSNLNVQSLVLDKQDSSIIYAATAEGVFQYPFPLSKGDVDGNGEINVLDVVQVVNIILDVFEPSSAQFWAADYNNDGLVNVIDVIFIVNEILF